MQARRDAAEAALAAAEQNVDDDDDFDGQAGCGETGKINLPLHTVWIERHAVVPLQTLCWVRRDG